VRPAIATLDGTRAARSACGRAGQARTVKTVAVRLEEASVSSDAFAAPFRGFLGVLAFIPLLDSRPMSLNYELSELFRGLSQIMEIKSENPFKAIAFQKVSRILRELPEDIGDCVRAGTVCDIQGIGEASRAVIEEYVKTGHSTAYDEVAASVPAGLIPLLRIPGLGPKTIAQLWKERGVTNMEELVKFLDSGLTKGLKGIGEKKIQSIRDGIAMMATAGNRIGILEALPIAQALVERLRALKQVKQAEIAGSLRRRRETIGDVDLVCALKDGASGEDVSAAFVAFPETVKINGQGPTKASIVTAGGLQVDLRIVPTEHFGSALLYFTGSKEHNVKIRGMAQGAGLTLNEWGLYDLKEWEQAQPDTKRAQPAVSVPKVRALASKTEGEVYKRLGLRYVEPEMREDRGEVEAAKTGELPVLIELADIKGDLHMHTTASDGSNSIDQMAEAAIARGYEFIAITDHSQSQVIANGLKPDRLIKHMTEVRKADERIKGIKILAGAEVDILADGRLDYEDALLKELDFVVASPHQPLKQDPKLATDRLVRAAENPYVNVIGHPTGRLIMKREGLSPDLPRVFKAAALAHTAMEINASYPRLDLSDLNARLAIRAGVILSINTDSHSTDELELMEYGVHVARRAWATKANVINCMTWRQLEAWLKKKRG
jgi:DNA polymerase (family 10)